MPPLVSCGDEFIDAAELKQMCIELGHDLSAQELEAVMQALDATGDERHRRAQPHASARVAARPAHAMAVGAAD